jgi:hypothetical protein
MHGARATQADLGRVRLLSMRSWVPGSGVRAHFYSAKIATRATLGVRLGRFDWSLRLGCARCSATYSDGRTSQFSNPGAAEPLAD